MDAALRDLALRALDRMTASGFEHAQATATAVREDEVNIEDNQPSLLRSVESLKLALVGVVEGRRAVTETNDVRPEAIAGCIDDLLAAARSAPTDAANRVSSGQRQRIVQGPQRADLDLLTGKAAELLAFYGELPKISVRNSWASHSLVRSHTLTTGGSDLEASVGSYSLLAFALARDGTRVTSMQVAEGRCHDLEGHASGYFGIDEEMRSLEQQLGARPMGEKFVGDVVLAPQAVRDLVAWFLAQLGDEALIAGCSLYRDQVGQGVASSLLSLRSRFDAPGVAALSSDGFVAAPVEILREGRLQTLTPSLYGSLKTGLAHVPTAAAGWEIAAGDSSRAQLVSQTAQGALVGRFAMGRPGANGDFAGVIKNSFRIVDGRIEHPLAETMICGNVGAMLRDVVGVSRERRDTGDFVLPWLRVTGLHFS